jgi:hypothetical protein
MASIKAYVSLQDQRSDLSPYKSILQKIDVTTTPFLEDADVVLPLTDASAQLCIGHSRFMPAESFVILFNKDQLHLTGVPTLPSVLVEEIGDTAAYHFKRSNPVSTLFVQQPLLTFPMVQAELTFSVNNSNAIYVFNESFHVFNGSKMSGKTVVPETSEDTISTMLQRITAICTNLNITGGIYNVQFVEYNGELCLIDWNMRPPGAFSEGFASSGHIKVENLIRNSFGLPIVEDGPISVIFREYSSNPIPFSKGAYVKSFGLFPRRLWSINNKFVRVCGIGTDEAELISRFNTMEAGLLA